MAPPELVEDAITEILLRIPPEEPAHLFLASLVCKRWRRILSDPAFLRLYRRFHRDNPPLLGFFQRAISFHHVPGFVPTTASCPSSLAAFNRRPWVAIDSRHGRVLFRHKDGNTDLFVYDLITGQCHELRRPAGMVLEAGMVLCATAGCDHCDCNGGPFLVVGSRVSIRDDEIVQARVYSSQLGDWGVLASFRMDVPSDVGIRICVKLHSGALIGDDIYFLHLVGDVTNAILKFDVVMHNISMIDPPPLLDNSPVVLMPVKDGLLGIATTTASTLCLWSRMENGVGVNGWVQHRVIELQRVLLCTENSLDKVEVVGFAQGIDVIFLWLPTYHAIFTLDLKSGRATKLTSKSMYVYSIVPVMGIYAPGCSSTDAQGMLGDKSSSRQTLNNEAFEFSGQITCIGGDLNTMTR